MEQVAEEPAEFAAPDRSREAAEAFETGVLSRRCENTSGDAEGIKAERARAIVLEVMSLARRHEHHVARPQGFADRAVHQPTRPREGLDDLQVIMSDRFHPEAPGMVALKHEHACGG